MQTQQGAKSLLDIFFAEQNGDLIIKAVWLKQNSETLEIP